jgi:hypothetical protein
VSKTMRIEQHFEIPVTRKIKKEKKQKKLV